jgi:hypothetical protein
MNVYTFVIMSVTPTVLAGILFSKHRHSGVSTTPGEPLYSVIRGGMGTAGRDLGK